MVGIDPVGSGLVKFDPVYSGPIPILGTPGVYQLLLSAGPDKGSLTGWLW